MDLIAYGMIAFGMVLVCLGVWFRPEPEYFIIGVDGRRIEPIGLTERGMRITQWSDHETL